MLLTVLIGVLAIGLVVGVVLFAQGRSAEPADAGPVADAAVADAPVSSTAADARTQGGNATGSAPASRTAPTTTTPTSAVLQEDQALAQLESLNTASLRQLVLDDRWVAQVASKSVGITDPLQVAANGTHVFYAADILAEVQQARATAGNAGEVLVLQSTDFGKRSTDAAGQPYWVTVVDAGFTSSVEVKDWCARTYWQLDAEQLANACAPRTLNVPHD
jgi:hypothetical protein